MNLEEELTRVKNELEEDKELELIMKEKDSKKGHLIGTFNYQMLEKSGFISQPEKIEIFPKPTNRFNFQIFLRT